MSDAVIEIGWDSSQVAAGAKRTAAEVSGLKKKVQSSFLSMGTSLAGFFSIGAITGAAASLKSTFDQFDNLNDLAQRFDADPEKFQRLALQAKLSGTDIESVTAAMTKFNRALSDAGNDKASGALKELGVGAEKFIRLDVSDQVKLLADSFQKAESKGKGTSALFNLLGKNAAELFPLLRTTREELEKIGDVKVLTESQLASIAKFNDLIDAGKNRLSAFTADFVLTSFAQIENSAAAADEALEKLKGTLTGDFFASLKGLNATAFQVAITGTDEYQAALTRLIETQKKASEQNAINEKDRQARRNLAGESIKDGTTSDKKQGRSKAIFNTELAIAEARKRGTSAQIRQANEGERQLKILREQKEIMESLNLSEAEALVLAKRKVEAESKGPNRIKGFKREQGPKRTFEGLGATKFNLDKQTFKGLDALKKLQDRPTIAPPTGRKFGEIPSALYSPRTFGEVPPSLASSRSFLESGNKTRLTQPLEPQAAANAAAGNAPKTTGNPALDKLLEAVGQTNEILGKALN